jgi:hypothetical protein
VAPILVVFFLVPFFLLFFFFAFVIMGIILLLPPPPGNHFNCYDSTDDDNGSDDHGNGSDGDDDGSDGDEPATAFNGSKNRLPSRSLNEESTAFGFCVNVDASLPAHFNSHAGLCVSASCPCWFLYSHVVHIRTSSSHAWFRHSFN